MESNFTPPQDTSVHSMELASLRDRVNDMHTTNLLNQAWFKFVINGLVAIVGAMAAIGIPLLFNSISRVDDQINQINSVKIPALQVAVMHAEDGVDALSQHKKH